jgi:arginine deiminase
MAHRVRRREVVHLEAIVRHHPMVRETAPRVWREDRDSGGSLEGGDLLVVGDGILVAGCGGRSGAGTVERLAAELFSAGAAKEVVAVVLPDRRSELHLDSVFSQVDRDAFVVYADLVHRVDTYALRPGAGGRVLVDPQDHLPARSPARWGCRGCGCSTRATTR